MTGAEEVKVLGAWESPFVMRVRIALNLKGVSYEFAPEKLGDRSELLLKSNPVYKKIPVLIHNGKSICESLVIVQYIDEVWSSSASAILPANPYDRATARFWATYIEEKWLPVVKGLIVAPTDEANAAEVEKLLMGLLLLEDALKKCSKGRHFFGGDSIGYVDIALGCILPSLEVLGKFLCINLLDEDKTPLLIEWAERFRSDKAVSELLPKTRDG